MLNISVKEYIDLAQSKNLNYSEFIAKYQEKVSKVNKKFGFLNHVEKLRYKEPEKVFYGLPVSFKDCICVKEIPSRAGSKILDGYKPPFDAHCVDLVKNHGGAVLGKTNQDEFGFGSFSTNSGYQIPKNPHDPKRVCGGSSGGSAGLVAALQPHISVAESTGGSISCPAAYCGTVGLTPTYGLISRYGLISYANSLDKIGPIGQSVYDVALMLSVIGGHDPKDQTSIKKEYEFYMNYLGEDVKGFRIGIPKEYFSQEVDKKIKDKVWEGIKKLESLGCSYEEISLPYTKYALAAYYIISTSEASTNLAKYCGMRYGVSENPEKQMNTYFSEIRSKYFGEEAKRRVLLGTFARMAGYRDQYYLKAMKVRTKIIKEFKQAFKKFDVLITPTMPNIAPKFSEVNNLPPLEMYMMDILTVAPNLAGIPMISVPCGKVSGMPVGMHILGDHLQEKKIISIGDAFENL